MINGIWQESNGSLALVEHRQVYIIPLVHFDSMDMHVPFSNGTDWKDYDYLENGRRLNLEFVLQFVHKIRQFCFVFQDTSKIVYYLIDGSIETFQAQHYATFFTDGVYGYGMSFLLYNPNIIVAHYHIPSWVLV